jgi:transcriptional regulator with XRE-family HTH domain
VRSNPRGTNCGMCQSPWARGVVVPSPCAAMGSVSQLAALGANGSSIRRSPFLTVRRALSAHTTKANAMGDYLRARREQLRPDDVGLVPGARRRVPGLRREEVATLAGVSSAYYLRLEQGRDTTPSGQVVEALAQALRLDRKATEYLRRLASSTGSGPLQSTVQTVRQRLHQLVDQMPFPAIVCNVTAPRIKDHGDEVHGVMASPGPSSRYILRCAMVPLVICVGWRWERSAEKLGSHGWPGSWPRTAVDGAVRQSAGSARSRDRALRSLQELPSAVDSLCRRPDRRECWCSTW